MENIKTEFAPRQSTQDVGGRAKRVTISSLAESLGMTKGTVSKALNGYSDVSEKTRIKVHTEARRLGYRPLSHAQAIRTGRVRALGLVLSMNAHDGSRPFLAEFLDGLTRTASAEGWTLTIATADSSDEVLQTIQKLIAEHKADGFILPRTLHIDPRIALLHNADIPFVLYGRSRGCDTYPWFDFLGEDAMAEAVSRLAAQGHRRIGFLNASHEYHYAKLREQGFCQGLRQAGLNVDDRLILRNCHTADDGKDAAQKLLEMDEPPTAIVCATDMVALGVYDAARALGLVIGDDLSVIGYDGIPEGAFAQPPLTTFGVNNRDAGRRLATLLIHHIRGEPAEDLQETAKAQLIARGSDGPPNSKSAGHPAHKENT